MRSRIEASLPGYVPYLDHLPDLAEEQIGGGGTARPFMAAECHYLHSRHGESKLTGNGL